MSNSSLSSRESGQILLVVVLLMVVVLTIGLSLATRSLTNVRQTAESDDSQRAFSAAEAGIQVALESQGDASSTNFTSGTGYTAVVKPIGGNDITLNQGEIVPQNEAADLWLSTYQSGTNPTYTNQWSGTFRVYWGGTNITDNCLNSALTISVVSGSITAPTIRQYALDPCTGARKTANSFSSPVIQQTTVAGRTYRFNQDIIVNNGGIPSNGGYFARVIPLYADTWVAVRRIAGPALPSQGRIIESVGTAGNSGEVDKIQRKIVVIEGYPKLPLEFFPYSLFTASSL